MDKPGLAMVRRVAIQLLLQELLCQYSRKTGITRVVIGDLERMCASHGIDSEKVLSSARRRIRKRVKLLSA